MQVTPGCYIDSHHGHYGIPAMIEFAHGHGFPLDPFAEFTLSMYPDHYHTEDYPTESLFELADEAEAWLNYNRPIDGHHWAWNDGDFGLWADGGF